NAFFLASREGRVVGMQSYVPQNVLSPLSLPDEPLAYLFQGIVMPEEQRRGTGAALLAAGMEWARDAGLTYCALHFLSANLAAARFWQSHGFWPLTHMLARHVDERVAWADR